MTREQGRGACLFAFLIAAGALIVFVFIATEGILNRDDELGDLLNASVVMLALGEPSSSPALAENMGKAMRILERILANSPSSELASRGAGIISDWAVFHAGNLSPRIFCAELKDFLPILNAHHRELTKSVDFLLVCSGVALAAGTVAAYLLLERLRVAGRHSERAREKLRDTLEVEERERRRIARDLHDDAAQTIAAARMLCERGLASKSGAELRDRTSEASELLREAGLTIRGLVMDLRPPELEAGLGLALESLCSRRRSAAAADIAFRMQSGLPSIPNETAIQVYRIAQEGLANAAKHAQGSRVEVELGPGGKQGWLSLGITNGLGAGNPRPRPEADASLSTGNGISIMRERAELIGGKLEFELGQGGARLSLVFPIESGKGKKP